MNADRSISDILRITIYAISKRYAFDVEDPFLHILKDAAQFSVTVKVFAPLIQKVIDHAMQTMYLANASHKCFIATVSDL